MKKDVIALSQIALRYRDTVNKQWWGCFPGTDADRSGMKYMTDEFTRLGLKVVSDWSRIRRRRMAGSCSLKSNL
jgi:hypothetical protein